MNHHSARPRRRPGSAAARATAGAIRHGAEAAYVRKRDLRRLLPLDPRLLDDPTDDAQARIVSMLSRALRMERQRGRAGHWTYDLNRHIGLAQAFVAESRRLRAMTGVRLKKRQSKMQDAAP